eukprot:2629-Heterococcus_DN1.PRE.2
MGQRNEAARNGRAVLRVKTSAAAVSCALPLRARGKKNPIVYAPNEQETASRPLISWLFQARPSHHQPSCPSCYPCQLSSAMIISNELILHDMMNSQDKLTHPAVVDELARALILWLVPKVIRSDAWQHDSSFLSRHHQRRVLYFLKCVNTSLHSCSAS